jgi:hypothetical protein
MNADERTPGQQGYGQQSPQQFQNQQQPASQQPSAQQQQQQPSGQQQGQVAPTSEGQEGGSMATGQASYGNSGEATTLSQNSSSFGQDSDLGQSDQSQQSSEGSDSSLFRGSDDDLGSAGSGQAGGGGDVGGSGQIAGQQGSGDQDFADQGQGALNEDLMGSDDDGGTTDIEVERSQGRESDIEGSSL